MPQDREFAEVLLRAKAATSLDLQELNLLEFAGAFMKKLRGAESGHTSLANEGSKELLQLCKEECPVALV
jgi:hypothetical protein